MSQGEQVVSSQCYSLSSLVASPPPSFHYGEQPGTLTPNECCRQEAKDKLMHTKYTGTGEACK